MALWELPELGENMGVFWWWNHQNTPIYPLYHGDSQRSTFILKYIFGDYAIIHGLFSENQIKSRKLGCFLLDLAFMNCYNEGSGYWPYSYMWSFLLAQKHK